jgi:hypothetical protein
MNEIYVAESRTKRILQQTLTRTISALAPSHPYHARAYFLSLSLTNEPSRRRLKKPTLPVYTPTTLARSLALRKIKNQKSKLAPDE